MTDAMLASSSREAGRSSEIDQTKKPDPISTSNAPKLSSPFPSPTEAKRPASSKLAPSTDVNEGDQGCETSQAAKEAYSGTQSKENFRSSSTQRDPPREGSSLNTRPPNKSTEDNPISLPHHKHQHSATGISPPSRAPSVQFRETDTEAAELPQSRPQSRPTSLYGDDGEQTARGRSFITKLKSSFTSHSRSASGGAVPEFRQPPPELATPGSERGEFRFPEPLPEEGSDIEADAEESGAEHTDRPKRKKILRRPRTEEEDADNRTAPTTPKAGRRPSFHFSSSFAPFENYRQNIFPRRASTTDFTPQPREGVSEDEGRERLNRRKRSAWAGARGMSYIGRQQAEENQEEQRPSQLRRLTGLAGPSENAESLAATWRRHRNERGTSASAQRWRQIKAGFKLIGQRRKVDNTIDNKKSAELLAELSSAVPAALILASFFQRDEHGSKRIPILLEQVKVRVTDSRIDSHSGDRHLVFRIELEYGSGMTRMKWIIFRTLKDFANLHLKYKLHLGTQKYIQLRTSENSPSLPRFPRSAFPYLRGVRGLESEFEDEDEDGGYETGPEPTSGTERAGKKKKQTQQHQRRPSGPLARRKSSITNPQEGESAITPSLTHEGAQGGKKETYPERQRKKLEMYLQKMIRFLIFRADSNRLCKFLELSALGVRLAAEGSYHGKEGFLIIQSSKGLDFRRALNPSLIKKRHWPKWFLVRHSYVVCVDSPEEMNIYDVFLVDSHFKITTPKISLRNQKAKDLAKSAKQSARHPQHHTLRLENSERKLKLLARNERQLQQFDDSIRFMAQNTPWMRPNRFDSFAPVRQKCFAQWLVDARDHMWVVSRAINQAKDVIYIHDWWLSPELYMRRPAAISQKWRLDRLLQQKAREGVKIFVIMYRNINSAIPIDSEYSKFSLLELHPNIFVQRSPNQFRQNTFFWAHHEKLCLIDHTLAFVGGIDLCFGRWDTPQHKLTDDKPTGFETADMHKDPDNCQLWPGKDYSNPRIQDFYDLDKPYEEMYDRNVVPRMPWHDISMHVVGQPARDLTRHFVQRWNYILRQRKPTRPTPFLLPPPDFNPADLEALGLDGTCEVQILRSSSMWSTGTPDVTEHSIMNAYVKLIEESEHFVYIENQFFISTCEIDGRKIENLIGDALVERIVRAAKNGEAWRAVIVIPLMPGFQNTVDSEGGTSVRLIMQCQYRSICRGETSIFGRLRALGIEPEDFIQFFSLRTWGKIGPQQQVVTEQLYIHAKCMVVDDRAAIIGSANINERSMLGSRDSEVASVVRDTDMITSTMNGKPYLVGRFPHTLRMRLMREHLGIDVDELLEHDLATEEELRKIQDAEDDSRPAGERQQRDSESSVIERQDEREMIERRHRVQDEFLSRSEDMHSFNHDVDWEQGNNPNLKSNRRLTADPRVTDNSEHRKDVDGEGVDNLKAAEKAGRGVGRDSQISPVGREALVSPIHPEGKGTVQQQKQSSPQKPSRAKSTRVDTKPKSSTEGPRDSENNTSSDTPSHGHGVSESSSRDSESGLGNPMMSKDNHDHSRYGHAQDLKRVFIDKDCMKDPVNDAFYLDTWQAVAEKNTKIYRSVFRCMPDSEVKNWKEYKEYAAYGERFAEMQSHPTSKPNPATQRQTGPGGGCSASAPIGSPISVVSPKTEVPIVEPKAAQRLDEKAGLQTAAAGDRPLSEHAKQETVSFVDEKFRLKTASEPHLLSTVLNGNHDNPTVGEDVEKPRSNSAHVDYSEAVNLNASQSRRRRRRATTIGSKQFHATDDVMDKDQAEDLLNKTQGHLILWPYDWLEKEEQGGNWLYALDQISPLEIYN
ncbi:Phospholipase D eukaryota [Penicillium verhagenii]|uniref:Phospholipase D eukaryota n=1 Tax=Penicillium verhagenii TaxID=1562060 RepID=UPI0025454F8E|nr:Phospholipase D eukaryota [Penicillium verhagenii]KAJ5930730.1 Phospholipase D eukaryota [Penicillium verhagenii]